MTKHVATHLRPTAVLIAAASVAFMAWGSAHGQAAPAPNAPPNAAPNAVAPPDAPPDAPPVAPPVAPPPRPDAAPIKLTFKDATVDTVLEYLSEVAGLIIIKDQPVPGRITVMSRQPLSVSDAVIVLNSVLKEKGFAAVRTGRTLKLVALADAKTSNIPVRAGRTADQIAETDEVITQVVPIRYAEAVQLRRDLEPLIPDYAHVTANAASNTLIITDTSANIHRLVKIVEALDTAIELVTDIKVFTLQFADATDTARLINQVFRDAGASSRSQQQSPFARFFSSRGGGGGEVGRDREQGGSRREVPVQASADERTNTVVVSGPPETLDVIARVIKDLDSNPIEQQAVFVYAVRNGQAANMEKVLNNLFGRSEQSEGRARTTAGPGGEGGEQNGGGRRGPGGGGEPSSTAPYGGSSNLRGDLRPADPRASGFAELLRREPSPQTLDAAASLVGQVYVVADADTNSLLVLTASRNFEKVRQIITELDKPVPQVLIKVLIAEVTHTNSLDLGAEWRVLDAKDTTSGETLFSDFAIGSLSGGLIFKALNNDFSVTLRALAEVGKLDVLSRPYILASDNQLATITVGSEVPFIRNTRVTETGQTINTIQYDDVGIILNVTPHINPDGVVVMEVAPEISAISGDTVPISETVNAPVIAKRSAATRVAIRDGQTIVIGGLMGDQKTTTVSKIPLLGDIPILGALFQRQQHEKQKTELLIFLTPHVAKQSEDLKPMSEDEEKGVEVVPNAVEPGTFQKHLEGLKRGQAPPSPQPPASGAPDGPAEPHANPADAPPPPGVRLQPDAGGVLPGPAAPPPVNPQDRAPGRDDDAAPQ